MTIPLFLVAVTALGLLGALALFVSLKREVEARVRRESERVDAMLTRLIEAETRLAAPSALEPQPVVVRSGLNLSKRTQVIRLLRQGEDTGQIALELGLSRAEVQLLASIQTINTGALSKVAGAD